MENIDLKNQVVEATDVADVSGAQSSGFPLATDENLSVDTMYQQAALPSLGRQIFSVVPMNGPTAALFNIKKKAGVSTDFELLRNEVVVLASNPISTGISQEVVQDIRGQFGKEANVIIGTLLRGLANGQENDATLAFLDNNAVAGGAAITISGNAEENVFNITQRVQELVLRANSEAMRTYEAFCVLPYTAGAAIAALSAYVGGAEGEKDERGLFIGQYGQTKYFMNPDATSSKAYVGLKDTTNPSKSSAVFSPYVSTIQEAQDPNTGALKYFIYNRFAITASPLHTADTVANPMLFTFDIA